MAPAEVPLGVPGESFKATLQLKEHQENGLPECGLQGGVQGQLGMNPGFLKSVLALITGDALSTPPLSSRLFLNWPHHLALPSPSPRHLFDF
ncbi:hypothetical protein P7K49_009015 [Saguinus oedipus]|uniref:Uncharacterized protein n=1 Tax=Saguinus oedipus TaxID=9490 RepID=A0ABQ9VZD1_SAGOE|nr:hypothetical protein P7K49_009015 [Saguinus oedipus]